MAGAGARVFSCLSLSKSEMMLSRQLARSRIDVLQRKVFGMPLSTSNVLLEDSDKSNIEGNPFFNKYADKIKQAEREGRVKSPKSLHGVMDPKLKQEAALWASQFSKMEKNLEKDAGTSKSHGSRLPENLNEILDVEKIKDKSPDEIGEIWKAYYKSKECVSAVIPAETYDRIQDRAQQCPLFLYPLPKNDGYQFVLSQFSKNTCHFTSLINFQAHGDNAPWQLVLTHYTDFKESKGIVLMTSEVDTNALSIIEAQCLAQQLQMFYATSDEERFALVHSFNHSPAKFDYHNLIKDIESSGVLGTNLE